MTGLNDYVTNQLIPHLTTNPSEFTKQLKSNPDALSFAMAQALDLFDPFKDHREMFDIGELTPLAGHSLGPPMKKVLQNVKGIHDLQANGLHAGHFKDTHPDGANNAHWYECDRDVKALAAMKALLGVTNPQEFNFTVTGLSQNLGMLVDNFYSPGKDDWDSGRTKIVILGNEFISDQMIIHSIVKRAITRSKNSKCFEGKQCPKPGDQIIKIKPNDQGIYSTQDIIDTITKYKDEISLICLSGIVFNTGQRLELEKILNTSRSIIELNNIHVILDLAHLVGNRPIDLPALPVTAAVGCSYKHLCGYAGSGFGIYVRVADTDSDTDADTDLEELSPIQGWTAADPDKVFKSINNYNPKELKTSAKGALAFRTSNPSPVGLAPVQTFLKIFDEVGFAKLFCKSECLTQYLILLLQHHLSDVVNIITPLDPEQRGATICISTKQDIDMKALETQLKNADYEVDTRPPSIIRITAHYAYNTFSQIHQFVSILEPVLRQLLATSSSANIMAKRGWGSFETNAAVAVAAPTVLPAGESAAQRNTNSNPMP